ncbi:MAG: hypothetical protein HQ515_03090 [Phycisphaeraceae bacterium]|nr:hypothetical protein [Phycisphaeraceae bacterium]
MGLLSHEQKQLLFDHCMGLASEEQDAQAELLISSNPDAANFYYEQLKALLSPLESLEREPCPDSLAEQTIHMLTERAHAHDEPRTDDEPDQTPVVAAPVGVAQQDNGPSPMRLNAWRSPVQIAAVAAILLFLVSVTVPALGMVRERARRSQCRAMLGHVFDGMTQYVSDFGRAPSVKTVSGEPYWKVGDQGSDNHSNTRRPYLLAKQGYVEPEHFLCPSRKIKRQWDPAELRSRGLQDFPSRDYIDFSSRIACDKTGNQTAGDAVLMADMNPLAELFPSDHSKPLALRLDEDILGRNSANHGGAGQNVLFNDGSYRFMKSRLVGVKVLDDIFMLQSMIPGTLFKGCELPDCDTDAFLAP